MKIRQIDLIGFKSFADKTTISFHDGITCIVGPNGCGKSNIVDSFRWVLGEQSAKSLRGEKMEEVIFQGTATKKQRGMAEVTLFVSHAYGAHEKEAPGNGNGETPDDPSTDRIIVSRRLYRSGESEYILNRRQCRLKDIRDVFLDTGLDVKSYSILDQGRITEILNTKPHERRYLIEEVAGVMKYKVRKAEALSKLESSKQNLQRISDIVAEVKRQMNSLDRQVRKAERYKRLAQDLREAELRISKREHVQLSAVLSSLHSEIASLSDSDTARRAEISAIETAIETKRVDLLDREKALVDLEMSLQGKMIEVAEGEKRIAVVKTNIENRKADITRLIIQQEESVAKREELSAKRAELDSAEHSLSSHMATVSDDLREKQGLLSSLEAAVTGREEAIEVKRKGLFSVSDALSQKRNEANKLLSSLETLKYRESVSLRDIASVKDSVGAIEDAIRASEAEAASKGSDLERVRTEADALKLRISSSRIELEQKRSLLSSGRETLASNLSRVSSLRELIVDATLADYLTGKGQEALSRMTASDLVSTESGFEIAVEAALSERVNALVIDNKEDLQAVLEIIREKNLPRTAILFRPLLDQGEPLNDANRKHIPTVRRAFDLVTFDETSSAEETLTTLKAAVSAALRDVYVAETLESALDVLRDASQDAFTVVTLDGEVVTKDGFVLAGQGREILKRKREIRMLQNAIGEQQRAIESIERDLTALAIEVSESRETLRQMETGIVEMEKTLSVLNHGLQDQKEDLDRKRRKHASLESELAAVSIEKQSLSEALALKTAEIDRHEEEKLHIAEEITALQQDLAASKNAHEEARGHFTDMKLAAGAYRERSEALRKEREQLEALSEELDRREATAVGEAEEASRRIEESRAELQGLEERVKALVSEADKLREVREREKEEIAGENQSVLAQETSLKRMRSEMDVLSRQLGEMNTRAVETRLRNENIARTISEKYDLDIAAHEVQTEGFDPTEDETRVAELQGKMKDLGPVNLGSLEEYDELKSRHDFMSKQQTDLTLSIAELEEAITRINATTKRKLREAYDALRAKFTEVFTTLFGGGRADIVLIDEGNILESGIEIIAQPPGKKLQNLNLLSGGEKALTSLALLFAGFLIKPSPLCILDEVDAPLDESNTVRFAQMLKNLSRDTQFVVITHNRTTMEAGNNLYGITMEEAGVSKVISLQFSELE
ncbi:MAG: chromosome segregation protein SMC [Chloroflexota bacterium]